MATNRQQTAIQKTLENGGNVSRAMREAGYSAAMAKNPQKLTKSKAWKELMAEYLPDKLMLTQLRAMIIGKDLSARAKGLDMGLRLKGRYIKRPEPLFDPLEQLSDEELSCQLREAEAELARRGYILP